MNSRLTVVVMRDVARDVGSKRISAGDAVSKLRDIVGQRIDLSGISAEWEACREGDEILVEAYPEWRKIFVSLNDRSSPRNPEPLDQSYSTQLIIWQVMSFIARVDEDPFNQRGAAEIAKAVDLPIREQPFASPPLD